MDTVVLSTKEELDLLRAEASLGGKAESLEDASRKAKFTANQYFRSEYKKEGIIWTEMSRWLKKMAAEARNEQQRVRTLLLDLPKKFRVISAH